MENKANYVNGFYVNNDGSVAPIAEASKEPQIVKEEILPKVSNEPVQPDVFTMKRVELENGQWMEVPKVTFTMEKKPARIFARRNRSWTNESGYKTGIEKVIPMRFITKLFDIPFIGASVKKMFDNYKKDCLAKDIHKLRINSVVREY